MIKENITRKTQLNLSNGVAVYQYRCTHTEVEMKEIKSKS
jgi:hypothetical protein